MEDLTLTPRLEIWMKQGYQPTVIICGEGVAGKTMFCKSLAYAMNWKLLTINHIEGLKKLTPEHDAILFDDFMLKDIGREQLLALLATDAPREIRVMHSVVNKPANLVQMMAVNQESFETVSETLRPKQYKRRLHVEMLDNAIIFPSRIKVDVTINNMFLEHSKIYNNHESIESNDRVFDIILERKNVRLKKEALALKAKKSS